MSTGRVSLDARLDEWGSRLFNVTTETTPRPRRSKRTPLDSPKPVSSGGRLSTPQARTTYVRQTLQAMVRRAPQVIVKLVRAPKGMKNISNNLTYISRDGLIESPLTKWTSVYFHSQIPIMRDSNSNLAQGISYIFGITRSFQITKSGS